MDRTDQDLLCEFADSAAPEAFEPLVRRHIDWVSSMAMRLTHGNRPMAEDVTQAVFLLLARRAASLRHRRVLSSWLFVVTRYCVNNALRRESCRLRHEKEAAAMRSEIVNAPEPQWDELAPMLEEMVGHLRDADQKAVLLRFYQRQSFQQIGEALRISEEAARKRVSRAVEQLRKLFARRGITVGVAALAAMLAANLTQPASAAMIAATVSATSVHAANIAKGVVLMASVNKTIGIAAVCIAALLAIGVGTVLVVQSRSVDTPAATTLPIETVQSPPQPAPAPAVAVDWHDRFNQVYRLDDSEMIKLVSPPFIPERLTYYTEVNPGQAQAIPSGPDSMNFRWRDGKLVSGGQAFGQVNRISSIMSFVFRFKSYEYDLPPELAEYRINGDWIIRDGLSQESQLHELCDIVRRFGGPSMQFEQREMLRPSIVVIGQFQYQSVTADASRVQIHLYRDEAELADNGGGGGSGSLDDAIQRLGSHLRLPVVTLITGDKPERVGVSDHRTSSITRLPPGPERDQAIQQVLDHFAQQTGLKLSIEPRAVPVWVAAPVK